MATVNYVHVQENNARLTSMYYVMIRKKFVSIRKKNIPYYKRNKKLKFLVPMCVM